ncbi:flagellar hook-associated protein FlgL [Lucifera butyrica]|nr:flagellar hook-associated protein FlgL [Lucifera butyrica]
MRITNGMISSNFMNNYTNALNKVTTLQNQLSSGIAVSKPSDDPVKMTRTLECFSSISQNDEYQQNANDAVSWMTTSTQAAQNIATALTTIKGLVSKATSVATDSTSLNSIADQINSAIDEIVQLGNTQTGGRYVFSGQNDQTQPLTRNSTTGVVTYSGTYDGESGNATAGTITMQISPGTVDPVRDKINIDGQELFGKLGAMDSNITTFTGTLTSSQPQLFADLNQIVADVKSGNTTAMSNDIGALSNDSDTVNQAQTSQGAKQTTYQTMLTLLTSQNTTLQSNLKDNRDLDVAQASISFAEATSVYNAALSVGAQVLPKTLVDYISTTG